MTTKQINQIAKLAIPVFLTLLIYYILNSQFVLAQAQDVTSCYAPNCATLDIGFGVGGTGTGGGTACGGTAPAQANGIVIGTGTYSGTYTPNTWTYDNSASAATPCKWKCSATFHQSGNTCAADTGDEGGAQCTLSLAVWLNSRGESINSGTKISEGTEVIVSLEGTNCLTQPFYLELYEVDPARIQSVNDVGFPTEISFDQSDSLAIAKWNVVWKEDLGMISNDDEPEYIFKVKDKNLESGEIDVTKGVPCTDNTQCAGTTDTKKCNLNTGICVPIVCSGCADLSSDGKSCAPKDDKCTQPLPYCTPLILGHKYKCSVTPADQQCSFKDGSATEGVCQKKADFVEQYYTEGGCKDSPLCGIDSDNDGTEDSLDCNDKIQAITQCSNTLNGGCSVCYGNNQIIDGSTSNDNGVCVPNNDLCTPTQCKPCNGNDYVTYEAAKIGRASC